MPFEFDCINFLEAPKVFSGDPKLLDGNIKKTSFYFKIKQKPGLARRHDSLGMVKCRNASSCLSVQHLVEDSK